MRKRFFYALLIFHVLILTACSSAFSIEGQWKSSGGTTIIFQDGTASASLFGFNGGPDGSYSLSSEKDENGDYILYGSHITGGEVEYRVQVESNDRIYLEQTENNSEYSFAPSSLSLERQ
ncbi:TPA: hypothetical protein TZS69_000129 [Streptococcus suis]|nr:hypothetical protein [Streptococcus suis]